MQVKPVKNDKIVTTSLFTDNVLIISKCFRKFGKTTGETNLINFVCDLMDLKYIEVMK